MFVTVEHLLAEREERLRRHVIVFKHDALVDNRERPLLRYIFRRITSVVALLIFAIHLTLPVDILNHTSASFNAGHIALATWSVLIEEQS